MSDPRPEKPVPPTPLEHTPTAPSTAATLVAEAFGTFLLVLGVISTALFAAGFGEGTEAANKGVGFLGVSLAVGLTVVAGAYAFGPISGGHFNPAVTLGLAAAGRFPWSKSIGYIIAQIIGGAVATTLVVLIGLFGPDDWLGNAQDGGFASQRLGRALARRLRHRRRDHRRGPVHRAVRHRDPRRHAPRRAATPRSRGSSSASR